MPPQLHFEVVSLADVPPSSLAPREEQRLVLVVDDEHVIADTLSVILTRSGFSVITAYNGESALELATEKQPDLLLSDVMMGPGIDGTELAMRLARTLPTCRVLLFSGHAATVDLLAQARTQGHDFTLMTKPVHPADLLVKISESFATTPLPLQN